MHKAGPYISAFHLESSQRLFRKVCRTERRPISLFLPALLSVNSTISLFPLMPLQRVCNVHVTGRCRTSQISEGDACGNVSQLISCWRNMVVIKRAFPLYGAYTSRPLWSRNHRMAESCGWRISHPDVPLGEFCGYSYQTIATFRTYTRTYSTARRRRDSRS